MKLMKYRVDFAINSLDVQDVQRNGGNGVRNGKAVWRAAKYWQRIRPKDIEDTGQCYER
jgi:hypothetical protein